METGSFIFNLIISILSILVSYSLTKKVIKKKKKVRKIVTEWKQVSRKDEDGLRKKELVVNEVSSMALHPMLLFNLGMIGNLKKISIFKKAWKKLIKLIKKIKKNDGITAIEFFRYIVPAVLALALGIGLLLLIMVHHNEKGYEPPGVLQNTVLIILGYYFGTTQKSQ